jgi:hypothetical protein
MSCRFRGDHTVQFRRGEMGRQGRSVVESSAEAGTEYLGNYCRYVVCDPMKRGTKSDPGYLQHVLPTNMIIGGPFLAILGGECVFQSTIFTLTSALAEEYVER